MPELSSTAAHNLMATAIKYLSLKPRFTCEVRVRLEKELVGTMPELKNQAIDHCLDRLVKDKFLDDEKLAVGICSYLSNEKLRGPRFIRAKLVSRGLSQGLVDRVIKENLTPAIQKAQLRLLIAKKTNNRAVIDSKSKNKLIRFLLSRGFTFDSILRSLDVTD